MAIDRDIPYDPILNSVSDFIDSDKILSQPFKFLDRGGQSYVFISQDQKTVIKFFKKQYNISDGLIQAIDSFLPASLKKYRFEFLKTRQERFYPIFKSFKIAAEHIKDETGIIYLHLNPTKDLPFLEVVDNLGISHKLNLNTTSFLIQRRAERIFSKMEERLASHDVEGAKQLIHNIFEYIYKRSQKGICDTDNGLKRNYGYIDDKAISLDVGSFVFDESLKDPLIYRAELERKTKQLGKWLAEVHPELVPYFEEELQACLSKSNA